MISGRDFIVISDDLNGLPTSAIHLFRRLATRNRVFWFNTIGRMPRFSQADAGKVLRKLGAWARGKNRTAKRSELQGQTGLHVVNPIMVPWFKPIMRRFNRRSFMCQYQHLADNYQISDPILVTTFPFAVDFMRALPGATKIYYCVDDFLDYPGVNHADWARMESELLEVVDGLIVTSADLKRKRVNSCPLLHLPHGVDFGHFFNRAAQAPPVPEFEQLPRPIVGFFGLISEWVDQQLVASLSDAFPHVSFVLLGRADVETSLLCGRPNVYCPGFVPYAQLPGYARYFDVGLIPFVLNQLTRAVNPLKLMEYFALGLPVLSTRLPELETIQGPMQLALTHEEFHNGLRSILANPQRFGPDDAIAVARGNTWEERVKQLSRFLVQLTPTSSSVADLSFPNNRRLRA